MSAYNLSEYQQKKIIYSQSCVFIIYLYMLMAEKLFARQNNGVTFSLRFLILPLQLPPPLPQPP